MPTIELKGNSDDGGWVMALMLFPNDERLRDGCFAVNRISGSLAPERPKETFALDAKTIELLLDTPSREQLKTLTSSATKKGVVAGDLLAAMYLMKMFEVQEPSMNKAIHIAGMFARDERWGDGESMDTSERMIRMAWQSHQSVSHLWAAFRLNNAYPFAKQGTLFTTEVNKLLGVALGVLEFATSFVPHRTRPAKVILSQTDAWAPPQSIEPLYLKSDRAPDRLLRYLETYKAPSPYR
jgi:hypothetical protein